VNLLTAALTLVVPLGSGYALTLPDPAKDDGAATKSRPACDFDNLAEVPLGEFDPLSVPMENGIVWYGTWEAAMAERDRTGKPVLLHFGSPRRPKDMVCVPGAW
jgi:hypothetical protein